MKYLIVPFLLCTLIACSGNPRVNTSDQKKEDLNITHKITEIKQLSESGDTLNDPHHPSYLADKSTREIGQMILDNKVQPIDNDATFRVMDSLFSKNPEDRKFYFKVFVKIFDKADGALAEAVGLPAMQYTEKYTLEFMDLSNSITDDQFKSWASFVGWEILLSSDEDPVKDGQIFTEKLKSSCTDLDEKDKRRLESFNEIILKSIRENNE